jgi:hypothetical protein
LAESGPSPSQGAILDPQKAESRRTPSRLLPTWALDVADLGSPRNDETVHETGFMESIV